MTLLNKISTLALGLALTSCNTVPFESLVNNASTHEATTTLGPAVTEKTSYGKSPKDELLAQVMLYHHSAVILSGITQNKQYWQQPLDLSKPDPYDIYPEDLYQVLRRNISFDLSVEDSRIDTQLRWYAGHASYINRVSDRASRYMYYIVQELQARDMPVELALLPIVESAFDPFAYSHGSASGMWQFIPSTGKMYGLKQNWWYDGRRDVVASTNAALDYLSALNKMFKGDWLLALASYNSGPGTVLKAQRKNRAAGKPTDFWHLDLPNETEAYVPKLYALVKLFHDPQSFQLTLPVVPNEPYFAIVETGGQIDLAQAAKMANMELSDLYILNPGYNRWATDPDGPHQLAVYYDREELFNDQIANLPANKRLAWKRYQIKSGDSLLTIAHEFDVTVDVIKDVNNIRSNLIRAGDTLLIPVASKGDSYYSLSAENRLKVKQNSLANTNKQRIDYVVKSGDSFWTIAKQFDVSVQSVAKWNNMAPKDVIRPGQTLAIWTSNGGTTTAGLNSRQVVRKVGYVVKQGDSLYRIADKFHLTINDIQKWNQISSKYLQPGDKLTLYVDVTRVQ